MDTLYWVVVGLALAMTVALYALLGRASAAIAESEAKSEEQVTAVRIEIPSGNGVTTYHSIPIMVDTEYEFLVKTGTRFKVRLVR